MIDPTRQELRGRIAALSAACPDYRFGQLVLNPAFLAREEGDRQARHVENAELTQAARKDLADWYAAQDQPEPSPLTTATAWLDRSIAPH